MPVAVFDVAAWKARYPEFNGVSDGQAAAFFSEASLYLDNTDCSPVTDVGQRLVLLNMLTAHVAAMAGVLTGGAPSSIVGRISRATEGTVTVEGDAGDVPAWYATTPYGFAYWQATRGFRQMTYIPGNPPIFDSGVFGRSPYGGYGWN